MEFYDHLFAEAAREHVTQTWLRGTPCHHGHFHDTIPHAVACPGRLPGDWIYAEASADEDGGHATLKANPAFPLQRRPELPKRGPRPRLRWIFRFLAWVAPLLAAGVVAVVRWWQS